MSHHQWLKHVPWMQCAVLSAIIPAPTSNNGMESRMLAQQQESSATVSRHSFFHFNFNYTELLQMENGKRAAAAAKAI